MNCIHCYPLMFVCYQQETKIGLAFGHNWKNVNRNCQFTGISYLFTEVDFFQFWLRSHTIWTIRKYLISIESQIDVGPMGWSTWNNHNMIKKRGQTVRHDSDTNVECTPANFERFLGGRQSLLFRLLAHARGTFQQIVWSVEFSVGQPNIDQRSQLPMHSHRNINSEDYTDFDWRHFLLLLFAHALCLRLL